ncbi:hypothetical protein [Nonomuraea roseola]|uniref:Uncharacterized protein n=1 Tax=Nonomuraea roseola TaxID=46179 RepID=A0ABV5PSZ4_9ACTN
MWSWPDGALRELPRLGLLDRHRRRSSCRRGARRVRTWWRPTWPPPAPNWSRASPEVG